MHSCAANPDCFIPPRVYLNKTKLGNMHREIFKDNFGMCFFYLQLMHTSNNEIQRVNVAVGPLQPGKEVKNKLATTQSDKHVKKYVKHHIHGKKNKHLGEKRQKRY